MIEISLEHILGASYGAGAVAFYFAAIDVVKERRGCAAVKDKLILAFVSWFWPYLILYQLFYHLLATIVKEGRDTK
jgi:hypothetical protein